MTAFPGGDPEKDQGTPPPFGAGHQVVYLPTGETWTVDRYVPPTQYRPASLLLGRSSAAGGVVRATIMDVDPAQVRLAVTPGRLPWPPYAYGDLVEDLLTGETWNVDQYVGAGAGPAAQVTLFRDNPGTGAAEAHTADPRDLRLILSWTDRAVFPGDGWSSRPDPLPAPGARPALPDDADPGQDSSRTQGTAPPPGGHAPGGTVARLGFPGPGRPGGELTEEQELVLSLERQTWQSEGDKNQTALAEHGMSVTRYYQVLAGLADSPAAHRADPALISRLRTRRAQRAERRSPRL